MNRVWLLTALLFAATSSAELSGETAEERKKKQAEMDAACEAARQKELAFTRARLVDECVEKKQRYDRASCERFYKDYGERSGRIAPLFYDLPECVKAHEYRTSYRRSRD